MLFIEYPSCSTCQKAKKWLNAHEIAFTDRHIAEENPTAEELREWIGRSGLELRKYQWNEVSGTGAEGSAGRYE